MTPLRSSAGPAIARVGSGGGESRGKSFATEVAPAVYRVASGPSGQVMHGIDFELERDRDYIELNHLLKLADLCDSGGAGKAIVASGSVSVDGRVELRKTCKIRAGQVVAVGEATIRVLPAS